jgi:hypothetical protein
MELLKGTAAHEELVAAREVRAHLEALRPGRAGQPPAVQHPAQGWCRLQRPLAPAPALTLWHRRAPPALRSTYSSSTG